MRTIHVEIEKEYMESKGVKGDRILKYVSRKVFDGDKLVYMDKISSHVYKQMTDPVKTIEDFATGTSRDNAQNAEQKIFNSLIQALSAVKDSACTIYPGIETGGDILNRYHPKCEKTLTIPDPRTSET